MWTCVRKFDENMFERLQANGFISTLNESIFEKDDEEIILCLGYDGLYGVNNINRYMQKINPSKPIEWGIGHIRSEIKFCSMRVEDLETSYITI